MSRYSYHYNGSEDNFLYKTEDEDNEDEDNNNDEVVNIEDSSAEESDDEMNNWIDGNRCQKNFFY